MCLGQGSQRWGRGGKGMRAWREKTVIPASMVLCVDSWERGYKEELEEWFVCEFLERPQEKKAAALWNWEEWERVREEISSSLKWPSYRWCNLTSRPAELPSNIWKEQQQLWGIPSLGFGGHMGAGSHCGDSISKTLSRVSSKRLQGLWGENQKVRRQAREMHATQWQWPPHAESILHLQSTVLMLHLPSRGGLFLFRTQESKDSERLRDESKVYHGGAMMTLGHHFRFSDSQWEWDASEDLECKI